MNDREDTSVTPPSPPDDRHRRFPLIKVLIFGSMAICLFLLIAFWPHLLWKLESAWLGCNDVRAVPTSEMADPPLPEDWKTCRFGPLEFSLPPELADRLEIRVNRSIVMLVFDDGSRSIAMIVPEAPQNRDTVFAALQDEYGMPDEGLQLSQMRLQLASYQASSDDFRWSMTRKELRWHAWCILMSRIYCLMPTTSAEYVLHDDIEGILDLNASSKTNTFSYQTADDRFAGTVIFQQHRGSLDTTFVRRVCQSCRFFEDRMPKPMPREENLLRDMFQVEGENGEAPADRDDGP